MAYPFSTVQRGTVSLHLYNDVEERDSTDIFVNYDTEICIITPKTAVILLSALEISQ